MKLNSVKLFLFFLSSLIVVSMVLSSCKEDTAVAKPGFLSMHMHTFIDTTEVENYGETLTLAGGRQINVSLAQLYISNVRLLKKNGDEVAVSSTILVEQGLENYDLGDVPSGDYKSIRFDVGLSNTTNASTPGPGDAVLNQPSMWFGVTAQPEGYVFVNFQGTIDTTTTLNGVNYIPFIYKIGTNAHRVTITMPDEAYSVFPDELAVLHIEADYGKLLDGIKLNTDENLIIDSAEANAWQWVDVMEANITHMFSYEE